MFPAQSQLIYLFPRVTMTGSTPGRPAVIGLTRFYCNQGEKFLLIDVVSEDASKTSEELANQGWEIEAEIPV
ncbi:hypothetical protein ETE01_06655 [Synechococcus sp. HB1133]|nr:hypothetical protein [Synechococcus sp. PH41509]NHI81463.1 hypothetical protein [Synechococcus sp. HB1133]